MTTSGGTTMVQMFRDLRRVGTSLVAIGTADPAATVAAIAKSLNGTKTPPPILAWDCHMGMAGVNAAGTEVLTGILGPRVDPAQATRSLGESLEVALKLPADSILFLHNLGLFLDKPDVLQGWWNLRDPYKATGRMAVGLGPAFSLPAELTQDVVVIEDPLPDAGVLTAIATEQCQAAEVGADPELVARCAEGTRGLSAFMAEQVIAMSLRPGQTPALDLAALWERKRAAIEQTDGLTCDRGALTFADIRGQGAITHFATRIMEGERPPAVIVRLDEFARQMAGSGGRANDGGVSEDAEKVLLTEMEDNDWPGLLATGGPGTGKSLLSKAWAGTFSRFGVSMDLGAMQDSLVGGSQKKIRAAMRVLKAIGGPGGVLFIATCNETTNISAAIERRFRLGKWFFDLPDATARAAMWALYLERYGLTERGAIPRDDDWTGAEIRTCVDLAWRMRCGLAEAATFVVPVAKRDPQGLAALRTEAHGRYLSVSTPGVYYNQTPSQGAITPMRKMRGGEEN